jgi:Transcription antiterminator
MHASETTSRSSWYCLRTQPRREFIAAHNLRQRVGVEVFAPRIRVRRSTRSGLVSALAEALFPGYLFARFDYPRQLRHVVSTSGVTGIVAFGAQPPVVADGVIEFLRAQIRRAEEESGEPVFGEGAWVRIVGGCFRDIEGRVLSSDSRTERVRVLLSLLGRDVQVSVLAQQLVALPQEKGLVPNAPAALQNAAAPVAG